MRTLATKVLLIVCVLFIVSARPGVAFDPSGSASTFVGSDEFGSGTTIPVAWGDFDNDGDLDLAVGNYSNQLNELYINNGDGTFVQTDAFGRGSTFAVVWGDYDNDGDLDMAVGNSGQNWLFENNGAGGFAQRNEFGGNSTVALAWGDCDNDGDLDMAVGNGILGTAQQNYLYVNNGDGTFTRQNRFGMGQTDSLAWGDFDDDDDLDLAVGNGGFGYTGQNYLYVNNGGGNFAEQPAFGEGDTAVVAWGDADGDGLLDLAVGNWGDGQNMLYINNGGGGFSGQSEFGARDTNTLAWGDYDHDGDLDLAVGNGDFGSADQNYLYVNDGNGSFSELAEFGPGSTDALAWGDCDGDGDLDMPVGNEHTPRQNQLYENLLDDANYVQLELMGRFHGYGSGFSNRGAVGAKVYLYEAGNVGNPVYLLGLQQVEAKGGFSAQNAMVLTFGVQGATHVDVEIHWPGSSGTAIVQRLANVGVGAKWVVRESMGDCGNGSVELGEACDTGIAPDQSGACPEECVTGDPCVVGLLRRAGTCWAACDSVAITEPQHGDGCCPPGANAIRDDDCPPVCANGICEAGEEITCVSDCECVDDEECSDSYVCTFDSCVGGVCTYTQSAYGDLDCNDTINIFDLLCVLQCFSGNCSCCCINDCDINPCEGNDTINIFDLLAVLGAFAGNNACNCPAGPALGSSGG